jgi:hypothetical protein
MSVKFILPVPGNLKANALLPPFLLRIGIPHGTGYPSNFGVEEKRADKFNTG